MQDRNPLLLYLAAWHIARELQTPEWSEVFSTTERDRLLSTWEKSEPNLRHQALRIRYQDPKPKHLASDRENILPLTIPYGEFVRMEAYSLLTAATLIHPDVHSDIRHRLAEAVSFLVSAYSVSARPKERYATQERLQPQSSAPKPYYDEDRSALPDLGTVALLLRIVRSQDVLNALFPSGPPSNFAGVRVLLAEDLVMQFDRYLCDPRLFLLTHPGMLAAGVIGDAEPLRRTAWTAVERLATNPPPTELTGATQAQVLSEDSIERHLEEIVQTRFPQPQLQISTYSLAALLLDRLRPGRYLHENLSNEDVQQLAHRTLEVYQREAFVDQFVETWAAALDWAILSPFLGMLRPSAVVLDAACGPGQYAVELMRAGHDVHLLDGSSLMLHHARLRFQVESGRQAQEYLCNLLDDRARDQPISENTYDGIWCSGLFAHIPRIAEEAVLHVLARWLRPGGILAVNIQLDNSRVFARDGRYYTFRRSTRDFERVLQKCGFTIDCVLRRKVQRNTYGEPYLEIPWATYYATQSTARA